MSGAPPFSSSKIGPLIFLDWLLEILEKHKEISIKDAAMQLNMGIKQIERLSEFLEEEGILAIDYKFAKPYLKLLEKPKKKVDVEKEKKPSVVIEKHIIRQKDSEKVQDELISILDKLISIIPSKVVNERILDLILKSYLEVTEKTKKIKMDKSFMDKCYRFNELFYFKEFLISMEKYRTKRDETSRLNVLKKYDDFNKTIKTLKEQYNFKPDNNLINKVEQIKKEI